MDTRLIDALARPAAWPRLHGHIERIETHISWVLLVGDHACKIKKPVDLGFLDFSTLEKRRYYCQEELRLNRRTAPRLYLDLLPISGTPERPEPGGDGPAIEYAVWMRRFDPELTFDRLLAANQLGDADIDQLAASLADLHRDAAVAPPDSRHGTFRAIAGPMRDNFDVLGERLDDARLESLEHWTRDELHRLNARIEQRLGDGRVRECHGDAHLGNVARIDGEATLFDCIEFSPELRWTDTACDLAFTVMDLMVNGADALAWRLLDRYLQAVGDYAGVRLLPLYIVYRALVRAKVGAFRLDDASTDPARVREGIRRYFALAARISGTRRPAVLITMGVSGSGKSWLAERLLERCGLVRIRSDVERKRLFGLAPDARSGDEVGRGLYTPEASARTYDRLVELARPVLDAGLPVLIDAANLECAQRERFQALAAELGVPFGILHTTADDDVLRERIVQRGQGGHDASDADLNVLARQQRTGHALTDNESARTLRIDTQAEDAVARAARWIEARIAE